MRLKDYLRQNDLSQERFAVLVGASQSSVSRWCDGVRPHPRHLRRIREVTSNQITLASFDIELEEEAA